MERYLSYVALARQAASPAFGSIVFTCYILGFTTAHLYAGKASL